MRTHYDLTSIVVVVFFVVLCLVALLEWITIWAYSDFKKKQHEMSEEEWDDEQW